MGKAKIISDAGKGFYNVEVLKDTSGIEERITEAEKHIRQLNELLEKSKSNVASYKDDVDAAMGDLNDAIASGDDEALEKAQTTLIEAQGKLGDWAQVRDDTESKLMEQEAEKARLDWALVEQGNYTELANCADYTTDLQPGDIVGLIEYGRQSAEIMGPGWRPIIQPGTNGQVSAFNSTYDSTRDGIVTPAAGSTPAGWLYNYIMEPGARKWRPTYRIAYIRSVDQDNGTANVSLKAHESRNTGRIDYPSVVDGLFYLNGVPIDYMDCDKAPFSQGNSVVIEFREDNKPYLIGFENGPVPCGHPRGADHPFNINLSDEILEGNSSSTNKIRLDFIVQETLNILVDEDSNTVARCDNGPGFFSYTYKSLTLEGDFYTGNDQSPAHKTKIRDSGGAPVMDTWVQIYDNNAGKYIEKFVGTFSITERAKTPLSGICYNSGYGYLFWRINPPRYEIWDDTQVNTYGDSERVNLNGVGGIMDKTY